MATIAPVGTVRSLRDVTKAARFWSSSPAPGQAEPRGDTPARAIADHVLSRPAAWQYGMAVVLTGYATLLSLLLNSISPRGHFLVFLAAVLLSTWYGSLGGGLFTTLLSFFIINYFFEQPVGAWSSTQVDTVIDAMVFLWVALLVSWLHGRLRVAWQLTDRARLEAERAIELRDSVLALISHDIKNPLSVIDMAAQLGERVLKRPGGLQEEEPSRARDAEHMRLALAEIRKSARGTRDMVDELLEVAYLQTGKPLMLNREPVDLVLLTQKTIDEMAQLEGGRRFQFQPSVQELTGEWDSARLKRVLQNLLTNAVKYSPPGSLIEISVAGDAGGQPEGSFSYTCGAPVASGDTAVLMVRDQGCGIPASEVSRVFEQFYRASNAAGCAPGTGIGLASVRQIVQQHGGTVAIASSEGKGTTFTVRLPLQAPEHTPG